MSVYIHSFASLSALGNTPEDIAAHLRTRTAPGMYPCEGWLLHKALMLGGVEGALPSLPEGLSRHDSRNNRLLLAALVQMEASVRESIDRYGPSRISIVMGTSTSGLDETDRHLNATAKEQPLLFWDYAMQELGNLSAFLAAYLQVTGPRYTVATACSSSARALISGVRLLKSGLCDAVLVGGADTLSRMPINGFNALELVSDKLCAPFARERDGITIGEGAGLMLLTREKSALEVAGLGESSDAHHISAPHPEGAGAGKAMRMALESAALKPSDIAYVNLHGTASRLNDRAEATAMRAVFGTTTASSTKYLTGHTLGASGIVELCLCALTLKENLPLVPQDFSVNHKDETLPEFGLLLEENTRLKRPLIMSNAFAFGGNNTSVILKGA